MTDLERINGLEELEYLQEIDDVNDYDSEVLCFLLKDENAGSIIGGRQKTYIEAKALMNRITDKSGLVIYKVMLNNGKRIFKAM